MNTVKNLSEGGSLEDEVVGYNSIEMLLIISRNMYDFCISMAALFYFTCNGRMMESSFNRLSTSCEK